VKEHALAGFLPVHAYNDEIHLVRTGPPPFTEPFLDQTIAGLEESAPRTTIRADALRSLQPDPGPVGIIVHCGRCGSTLLCRLLEAAGPVLTFREPNTLVNSAMDDPRVASSLIAQYAWMARAIGRTPFVKLPSTGHVVFDQLRPPPTAILVGLVRHPVPVVASLVADPPAWLLHQSSGPPDLESRVDVAIQSWTAAAARIERIASTGLLITYGELRRQPAHVVTRVLEAAGVLSDTRSNEFHATTQIDAKDGGRWSPSPPRSAIKGTHRDSILERTAGLRSRLAQLTQDAAELADDGDRR
jgi:hypothetical protein